MIRGIIKNRRKKIAHIWAVDPSQKKRLLSICGQCSLFPDDVIKDTAAPLCKHCAKKLEENEYVQR